MKVLTMKIGESVMVADQVLMKVKSRQGSEITVGIATTLAPIRTVPDAVADRFIAGLRRPPFQPAGLSRTMLPAA